MTKHCKLGEVCRIIGGGTPAKSNKLFYEGNIPWATVRDMTSRKLCETEFQITEEAIKHSATNLIPRGEVIISTHVGLGKVCILNQDTAINQDLKAVIPIIEIDRSYLYYWFSSKSNYIILNGKGATVKGVTIDFIKQLDWPLRNIYAQRNIVHRLDNIQNSIDRRKSQLLKLDNLAKSRFIEMFGSEQYSKIPMIELIEEGSGLSYGIVQPGDNGTGDMGVIRPVDLVDGKISKKSIKYIDRNIGNGYLRTLLQGHEIIISVRGTTGITAIVTPEFCGMNVTRGIAVIRYDTKKINPLFLNEVLNSQYCQSYIQENTRGATLKQINLSALRRLPILYPPIELQNEFAAFVEQLDKSKVTIRKSLDKLNLLYRALLQEYFG